MKKIQFDKECESCNATGIYVGMAEKDGAGIVCYVCKGTGCHSIDIEYAPFTQRKHHPDIKRVYQIGSIVLIGEGNGCKLSDFGGIPYSDWVSGKSFPLGSEDRRHMCPKQWGQLVGKYDHFHLDNCNDCHAGMRFSDCPHFGKKDRCWKAYDEKYSQFPYKVTP